MNTITLFDLPDDQGRPVSHTYDFPATWEDVSSTHLPHIINARIENARDADGNRPYDAYVRFNLLQHLAGIPDGLMKRLPPADALTYQVTEKDGRVRWQLIPELDWVFTPPEFQKSLMPFIEHAGIKWKGPDNGLDTMQLDQWQFVTTCRDNFRAAQDKEEMDLHLTNFMGALYQPDYAAWANEPIEEYGAKLADLPLTTKISALFNYEALHARLPAMYPRVFDPNGEASNSPAGIFSIAYEVAKSGVFGDIDKAEKRHIHKVFAYMEHSLYLDAREAERNTVNDDNVLMKRKI